METNFKWLPFDIEFDIRDIQVRFLLKFDYREFLVSRPNYKNDTYIKRNEEINSTESHLSLRYGISQRYELDGYQWRIDCMINNPVYGKREIDIEISHDKEGEWVVVHEFKKDIERHAFDFSSYNLKGDSTEQLMTFAESLANEVLEKHTGIPTIVDYAINYSKTA